MLSSAFCEISSVKSEIWSLASTESKNKTTIKNFLSIVNFWKFLTFCPLQQDTSNTLFEY